MPLRAGIARQQYHRLENGRNPSLETLELAAAGLDKERVSVLRLTLHGVTVGFLAGYLGGKNVLAFDPAFRERRSRPTLSLVTHPDFPKAAQLLAKPWLTQQRPHPVLSNMLPEGAQREHLAQALKVHIDHELPSRLRSAGRVARHTCGTGGHSRLPPPTPYRH